MFIPIRINNIIINVMYYCEFRGDDIETRWQLEPELSCPTKETINHYQIVLKNSHRLV